MSLQSVHRPAASDPPTPGAAARSGPGHRTLAFGQPVLALDRVTVRFGGVTALSDVALSVNHGERVALVGANGCGKSTLLRVLNRLLVPSAGRLVVAPDIRQAMLFQRPHMLRTTVQNNVALALWLAGMPWREARTHALAALRRVEMEPLAPRQARTLSGGQQQRLALARAWALQPDVLLLDEPTASLDPHAKREVEALMAEFAEGSDGRPVTMVFASHNLGQVKRLADRVIYLEGGRVLADLSVDHFFDGVLLQAAYPAAHLFVKGELL
jgi:tungstate transport system ATP-binding protein